MSLVRYVVGAASVTLATAAMAVCFSEELKALVDATVGSTQLAFLCFAWLGVHLLTFRRNYQPVFER